MPRETQLAVEWALDQPDSNGEPMSVDKGHDLVDLVRKYFNDHGVSYQTFSLRDLEPYLPQ